MPATSAFYAQSGGVTAVINASACGVIETARKHPEKINLVFAGQNGILGALQENLIDTSQESTEDISALKHTPGGAFGSCRYKLRDHTNGEIEYKRLLDVFKAHNIGYFFYNGGGDSMDTIHKISSFCQAANYPLTCIGIPKTIDNDLSITDNSPGFGSVAKYVATSTYEAALDVQSMAATSTQIFIMEVMGRHTGWIAASAALARKETNDPPHILLFPEVAFDKEQFLKTVQKTVKERGFCVIIASEGVRDNNDNFLSASATRKDSFGHVQLGGTAPFLANLIAEELNYKYHWAVLDYLQRSARHLASKTDLDQAYEVGQKAVELALSNKSNHMVTIQRHPGDTYKWSTSSVSLDQVSNIEKKLPTDYISDSGMDITPSCLKYLSPLIIGESYPPFHNGIPRYIRLKNTITQKKLPKFELK